MNMETIPPPSSLPSVSTEEIHPLSVPLILSSSSSSLKPLRERNRTNLKRRINLSRSQVLSNDFENDDNLPRTNSINKPITTIINSQTPSTPTNHTHTELYSKTVSPTTPSPIHTTVTCSQVWERLASNEEHQNPISPEPSITATTTTGTSNLPTHISFSYDPSDDDEGEDLSNDGKNDFKYVPVSSQSKLVQFQFLTFARQQQLDSTNDDNEEKNSITEQSMQEDEEDEEEQQHEEEDQGQENQTSKKRKRSVSTADSLNDIPAMTSTHDDASTSTDKPPCTKKAKIKDPNANFQRLNMRKKQFSHAKKHQFAKHKRNAFYRRTRNAGGNK